MKALFFERKVNLMEDDETLVEDLKKKIGRDFHYQFDEDTYLSDLDLSNLGLPELPPEIFQFTHLQMLSLSGNHLTSLPAELGNLSDLQTLFLFENQLASLPTEIGRLSRLQELTVHKNQLISLPAEIGRLAYLQKLSLYDNQLSSLPMQMGLLSRLQWLYLSNNQLVSLPAELGQLSGLQELHLNSNQLISLPVEIGQLSQLEKLSLYDNRLTSLPTTIGNLSHLKKLYLNNNQLTSLPAELGPLSGLQELSLSGNQLTRLPAEIGQLSRLRKLYLNNNQLTYLPAELGLLAGLQELHLNSNQLISLPVEIGQLSQLEKLLLYGNQLISLPAEIGQLSQLENLLPYGNQLTSLPAEIGQLSRLRKLYLNNNQLTYLPAELGQLAGLQELSLSGNQLTQLPSEIGLLPSLEKLFVANCPLLTPPPEIVEQGMGAILIFLQELHRKYIKRYEVKLIVVGEGGTGKTSLLRALHGQPFDSATQTTHGIELDTLLLPRPDDPSLLLTLNTWDFGGQQIYHATHQFFLTKRSLYLVIWNARLGFDQGRLHYWLDTIKALAPDAPVLLVATHTDERAPDLNDSLYKDTYPQVVGTVNVSNKDGTGIEDLKKILAQQATTLPLMGQPWPTSWLEVEKALMACEEHHISAERYKEICADNDVQVEVAQGTLGSYLHDLGKVLYFRDDYALVNLVVLKPNWVTKAISKVLENEGVRNAHGILAHSTLPGIWAMDEQEKPYDAYLYPVFLRLMERFDLSYQIEPDVPGVPRSHSLIPQLLPHQPPADLPAWPRQPDQEQAQLEMVYHFDFIPSGIVSWFIVRTHRYTIDKHWREGVLLVYQQERAYEQQYARVEMNPMLRELRLQVWGLQPHNFFTILKDTLEAILKKFVGLSVTREVPCMCHRKTHAHEPCTRSYRYEDLNRRMQAGKQMVECPETLEEVSVLTMLYGIHVNTAPQVHADIESSKQEILQLGKDTTQVVWVQGATIESGMQEILQHLQILHSDNELLLRKVQEMNQLTEWSVRNFTRLWNTQMRWLEAECPNTFILAPESKTPLHPKNLISQKYRLHLLCQHPSGPHRISGDPGYELQKPHDWWIKISPWLKHLVTLLRYGFPIAGLSMAIFDHKDFKALDNEIDLLGKLHEQLPEIVDSDPLLDQESRTEEVRVGSALRALYSLLNELDPHKQWAGLEKVITPDGNILWLCQEHAQLYQTRPLQLDNGGLKP